MAITCNGIAAGGIPLLTDITNSTFAINETLTFSATAGDVITSSAISFQDPADLGIPDDSTSQDNITFSGEGTTVITVGGNWNDPFNDQFTYVEKGTDPSLYPKIPVTVTQVGNMPSDKLLYDLNQDNTSPYIETFTVTVQWEQGTAGNLVAQSPVTFTLELKINNEYEGIRSFISNYYT